MKRVEKTVTLRRNHARHISPSQEQRDKQDDKQPLQALQPLPGFIPSSTLTETLCLTILPSSA
ncbi:hypothetical protein PYJP_06080 [Pyrofollis japonicus]|nr:hypothetical protein PYJP_06080 [Pyrofollis japonicus]